MATRFRIRHAGSW